MATKYFCDICGEEILDIQHWMKLEVSIPIEGRLYPKKIFLRVHVECACNDKDKKLLGVINGTK